MTEARIQPALLKQLTDLRAHLPSPHTLWLDRRQPGFVAIGLARQVRDPICWGTNPVHPNILCFLISLPVLYPTPYGKSTVFIAYFMFITRYSVLVPTAASRQHSACPIAEYKNTWSQIALLVAIDGSDHPVSQLSLG